MMSLLPSNGSWERDKMMKLTGPHRVSTLGSISHQGAYLVNQFVETRKRAPVKIQRLSGSAQWLAMCQGAERKRTRGSGRSSSVQRHGGGYMGMNTNRHHRGGTEQPSRQDNHLTLASRCHHPRQNFQDRSANRMAIVAKTYELSSMNS